MSAAGIEGLTPSAAMAADTRAVPVSVRRWRGFVYAACVLFAVAWTLALGKDVHWDALNYHLYLGFSALGDRFGLDFFAAGTPSYLNPYAYVPLYLMTRAGWPALWMAVAFAAVHAIVLWLTFEIAIMAGLRDGRAVTPRFAVLAVLLAAMNPVLLQGLGSTLTDLSIGVLVLAGWLAIAKALRDGGLAVVVAGGVLCGIATALKLSNGVFALAAVPALALVPGPVAIRTRSIALFCAACATAFAAVSLPWSYQLWREFANPFFPFLNQHFASPDFVTTPIRQERFVPLTLEAFLLRPFDMLSANSAVHVEPRAPDLRYVALLAALVAWVCAAQRRRPPLDAGARRALSGLLVGLAVAWCIWLTISGNGRYFLPMACVAGVVLALVLQRLHAAWPSVTIGVTMLVLSMQVVQLALGADLGRDGGRWEGQWLRVEIPDRLRGERHLFLSPSFLSGSAFLPYLDPGSGMMSVGGFNVIGPGHPGGVRAQRLIDAHADRLRLLLPLPDGAVDRDTPPGAPGSLRMYFRRFGLRVDPTDCAFMRIEGNVRGERRSGQDPWKHFVTCRLVAAPGERAAYERDASLVDPVFDRVEDACPELFFPRRAVTQEFHYWVRTYHLGSEMQLFIDEGRVKYFFYLRGGDPIDIGSVADWRIAPQPFDCSRRTSPAFGMPPA